MISYADYMQLLPKTELHCHFVSTMTAPTFIELARKYGVTLPTEDPETLFDFGDLGDFLVAFRAAHEVLRAPEDFARVAYEGVREAVRHGNLRYREYYVNPQYFFARGMKYATVMEPIIDGLQAAKTDLGVGFRVLAAINRRESPEAAVDLVHEVLNHGAADVVGIGQDDLTPENTEDPGRFVEAYRLAKRHGLHRAAHAGETDHASSAAVRTAIEVLDCQRIDHGYLITDEPELVRTAIERGITFGTTPVSTTICSGWELTPQHRIRTMIDEGLRVTVSSDDAMFFRTDVGREYREGLVALGVTAEDAKQISRNGIDGAFCDSDEKEQLHAEFEAEFLALDQLLESETP